MTNEETMQQKFCRPFGPDEVKQREGRGGNKFDYIDARSAHQRLDEVVGPGGWQTTFKLLDSESKAVECSLSVLIDGVWVVKTDVGYPNSAADAEDDGKEPLKAAYSDAMKRAAVQFGVGRHLYDKTSAARPRQAPPSGPVSQQAYDQAQLLALMADKGVTRPDISKVTGSKPTGAPDITGWFTRNPGKTVEQLVSLAVDTKQQELAGVTT